MSFTLNTAELPSAERRNRVYHATVSGFELKTGQQSGEPYINITLQTKTGKRFDSIFLKRHWFEPGFSPAKISSQGEKLLYINNIGAKNKLGKLRQYLGAECQEEFSNPEELVQVLQGRVVGKKFTILERQQRDKDTKEPTDRYTLSLFPEDAKLDRLKEGTLDLREMEEAVEA